jgi:hypothetical protein
MIAAAMRNSAAQPIHAYRTAHLLVNDTMCASTSAEHHAEGCSEPRLAFFARYRIHEGLKHLDRKFSSPIHLSFSALDQSTGRVYQNQISLSRKFQKPTLL